MQARSRPLPPEVVDLDVFLHEGTAAPARATQSLRWLTKQARVDLGLGMLAPPAGQARQAGPRGQAAVVEPLMLLKMGQRMEELYTQGDDRWQALLAAWMLYGGVLRHKHLTRAEVRKVTMSTVHAHCSKGKQRRLRKGFDFCVPGQLSTGWDCSAAWLHDFALVPEKQKADCGLASGGDPVVAVRCPPDDTSLRTWWRTRR